jgi:hypothetical protein
MDRRHHQTRADNLARETSRRRQQNVRQCTPSRRGTQKNQINSRTDAQNQQTASIPAARWIDDITKRALTTWRARLAVGECVKSVEPSTVFTLQN